MTNFYVPRKKRRQPSYIKRRSGVTATPEGFSITGSGGTRESVMKAAEIFAARARVNAAKFSARIPLATFVEGVDGDHAQVVTDGVLAPNAAPFEFGERHPLFGNRQHWYKQPTRAYMSNAATNNATIDAAADAYGNSEAELLAKEYGYTE